MVNSRAKFISVMAAGLTILAGCTTMESSVVSLGEPENGLAPSELPEYRPGDHVYYTNGRREKVIKVEGENVVWRRSGTNRAVGWRNPFIPLHSWDNSSYEGSQVPTGDVKALWPLEPGGKGYFDTRIKSINKETNSVYSGTRHWRCKVGSPETIALLAGNFDTQKVVCVRTNDLGKFRQESTWYYAPEIEQTVLKFDRYSSRNRKSRHKELMAFQPSMRMFDSKARGNYWRFFRETMESSPSGKTMAWSDRKSGNSVRLTPLKTLKQTDGTFCRQYRVEVIEKRSGRNGAGIACRDDKRRWRIPKKIDAEEGVSFRDA